MQQSTSKNIVNKKLKKVLICFHIGAVLYLLIGIGFLLLINYRASQLNVAFSEFKFLPQIIFLIIAIGIFIEIVVKNLKKNKYWAWVAGIIISILMLPNILTIILGIISLVGLLNRETIVAFSKK